MTSVADDSMELEAFRQRRQLELQQQLEQQAKQQADAEIESQVQAQEQQALDLAMKTILTPDARSVLQIFPCRFIEGRRFEASTCWPSRSTKNSHSCQR